MDASSVASLRCAPAVVVRGNRLSRAITRSGALAQRFRHAYSITQPSTQNSWPAFSSNIGSCRTAPSNFAAGKSPSASSNMRIRRRLSGALLRAAPVAHEFGQFGLGPVEFSDSLLAVDFDRQGHCRTQWQSLRRRLGNELVVGSEPQRTTKLRGDRHDAAVGKRNGSFHNCRLLCDAHRDTAGLGPLGTWIARDRTANAAPAGGPPRASPLRKGRFRWLGASTPSCAAVRPCR